MQQQQQQQQLQQGMAEEPRPDLLQRSAQLTCSICGQPGHSARINAQCMQQCEQQCCADDAFL
eukprot:scaffold128890_cov33-Tisochrysis_lutea.AAC.1